MNYVQFCNEYRQQCSFRPSKEHLDDKFREYRLLVREYENCAWSEFDERMKEQGNFKDDQRLS
jgi:hypothetical protein